MEEKPKGISEDWMAVWIGLFIFVLSLGAFAGKDILGWGVTTGVWTDMSKALKPFSAAYAGLGGLGSLIVTYVVMLVIMTVGAVVSITIFLLPPKDCKEPSAGRVSW